MDKMEPQAGKAISALLGVLKGLDMPLTARSTVSPSKFDAALFVPMDFEKLIGFIGEQAKADKAK